MNQSQYHHLSKRVHECWKAVIVGVIWLTLVVFVCAAVPAAFGSELPEGDITISSSTCVDRHWLDEWSTEVSALWKVKLGEYDHNDWNVEIRTKTGPGCFWGGACPSDWVTVIRVPYGAQSADLSGLSPGGDGYQFFKVNRFTGEEVTMTVGAAMSSMCSIMAPPDGAAWVWIENEGFELRLVDYAEVTYE